VVPATESEVEGHGDAFASPDISPRIIALAVNNIHEFMVRHMLVAVLNCTEKYGNSKSTFLGNNWPARSA